MAIVNDMFDENTNKKMIELKIKYSGKHNQIVIKKFKENPDADHRLLFKEFLVNSYLDMKKDYGYKSSVYYEKELYSYDEDELQHLINHFLLEVIHYEYAIKENSNKWNERNLPFFEMKWKKKEN